MTQPRYSVLNLFDPLNATPEREVTTPDSLSGSDKENAEPSYEPYYDSDKLTMTAFFNRTYKTQNKHYSPVVLKSRLIDVGDVTIMDETANLLAGLTIEEEPEDDVDNASLVHENMDMDDQNFLASPMSSPPRQMPIRFDTPSLSPAHFPTPNGQRPPLADLSIDATPVPRKAPKLVMPSYEHPDPAVECYSSPTTVTRASQATLAPVGSPLASVINAINFTEQKILFNERTPQPVTPTIVVSGEDCIGSSTNRLSPLPSTALPIHAQVSESILPASLPSSHLHTQSSHSRDTLAVAAARPRPRPRARAHTTSSPGFDPRRCSVDLHSSFNMQLQCPEASFDLINDRISFFGGDTFMIETDDFDMHAEEEMMNALAKQIKDKEAVSEAGDVAPSPVPQSNTTQTSQPTSPVIAANTPMAAMRLIARRSSLSPGMKLASPSSRSPMVASSIHEVSESPRQSSSSSPIDTVGRPALTSVTPPKPYIALVPAAPIHALRIVKRSKAHDRTTSMSSADSGSSSTGNGISTVEEAPVVPSMPIRKPVITGVRRPPPGLMPAPLQSNMFCKPAAEEGVRPALSVRSKLTSVLGLRTKATESLRSPIETCMPSKHAQAEKAASGSVKSRILKPTASSLSKAPSMRMPTTSSATAASKNPRPPSRFATIGTASGLPRPTGGPPPLSRLPAPTSSAPKSKVPSMSGSSSTIGRSATIRRA